MRLPSEMDVLDAARREIAINYLQHRHVERIRVYVDAIPGSVTTTRTEREGCVEIAMHPDDYALVLAEGQRIGKYLGDGGPVSGVSYFHGVPLVHAPPEH